MKSAYLVLVLFLGPFFTFHVQGQNEGTIAVGDSLRKSTSEKVALTGAILQTVTFKPLAGVSIFIDGVKTGDNSDINGQYVVWTTPGKHRLTVKHSDHAPIQKKLIIYSNGVANFEMIEKDKVLETVVVGDSLAKATKQKLFLTGTITQTGSGKPMPGAAVFIDGLKTGDNSDNNGQYVIQLPRGKHRVTVRHLGNLPVQKNVIIYSNGVLNFEMTEKAAILEEVVVNAKSPEENVKDPIPGVMKLSLKEIKRLPSFMGEPDIVRSLLLLPGISTVGEGSTGFNVRGGNIDQNLILLDNGAIFNSSHALGLFSNFNPDIAENFTLYKGNIPAQFGGRTSSVLNIRTRDGDFSKYKFNAGVGFVASRFSAEGPIVKDKTSFIVGARFSYSDWMLKSVKDVDVSSSSARFSDINLGVTHRLKKGSLSLKYYRGYDYFRYSNQFGYEYSTQLVSFKWTMSLPKNWGSTFNSSSGEYSSKLYDLDPSQAKSFRSGVSYTNFKQNFLYTYLDKHALDLGVEVNLYNTLPQQKQPYGSSSASVTQEVKQSNGREFSAYANEEYMLSPKLSISLGSRFSYFQSTGNDTVFLYNPNFSKSVSSITDTLSFSRGQVAKTYQGFEPRISAKFSISETSSVKLSYNRNRQYLYLISNTSSATPTDIWQMSNYHLKPQFSDNFSIGFFKNISENKYEFSSEVFYRNITNIVDYKNFAQIILNKHLETDVLQGQGKSYGIEVFLKKNSGNWIGWVSYTYSRSLNRINGVLADDRINNGNWYASNYDKPHIASLTASRKLGRAWKFGINFTYSTGRPITVVETYFQSNSISIPVYSDRNKYRIPDYWRADISFTLLSVFPKIDDELVFSVYNLLGRRNAYSVYYQQTYLSPMLQSYKLSVLGAALPSLTYNIRF